MNLKELSQALGLSQTTVSRALNGYPEVAESTRQRVMQAAAQNNYRPNARARGLATGRALAVGHVIPLSAHHEMVNPIFSDFIAGASEVYSQHGYDMLISAVADETEADAYRALIAKGTVDGMIVHGPRRNDPRIAMLRELGFPFVVHGRSSGEDGAYDWVDTNNHGAFREATEHLLELGHTRIGLLNGLLEMDFAARRLEGYTEAMQRRGLEVDPALLSTAEMTEANGHAAAANMLDQSDPPTAFLGASMINSFGIRRAAEERGLRLGKDISVIAFDDDISYLREGSDRPFFTSMRSSVREAGRICANRLLAVIAEPDQPPSSQLLRAELIQGASTAPRHVCQS